MRFFALITAVEAFTASKPEAALLQQMAEAKLETGGDTVLQMLTNMQGETQKALKDKQDDLAADRTSCDTDTASLKQEITSETNQRAQSQAEFTAYSAKEGAYTAKCAQLFQRKEDSKTAWQTAEAETNAAKTEEYNEQVVECNTLQSALMVLTNKQAMMQTGSEAMVQTMSKDMKDKLYDVVARETNVVDADTVMLAISQSKSTYSSQVGEAGGFGTIVGIVMGLHNHCLEARDRIQRELQELNDHIAEQQSLTEQIKTSDENQWSSCQSELLEIQGQRQNSEQELIATQNNLANAVKSLSDKQRSCNDKIEQATAFIRKHKEVDATITEVLAILDHAFAAKKSCTALTDQTTCEAESHCEWDGAACNTSVSFFLQISGPSGPAHARTDQGYSRVCNMLDKMREETERKKATFQQERRECNKIMPAMVQEINRLDSQMDDSHYRLNVLNIAIRGSLHDGHSSLNYQIEEKMPQEVITEKVELQRESNERKADSEKNAAEIAKQQRYISECKDAVQKLTKITGFSPDNDSANGTIGDIINMIENLMKDANNSIELATNTEKTNHADYMNTVADTNSKISLLMNQIAEKKGSRARKLDDELTITAKVEGLYNTHHNLGTDFQATCQVYGSTVFSEEDGAYQTTSCHGAAAGCAAHTTQATCIADTANACTWGDQATDGHASWSEYVNADTCGSSGGASCRDSDGLWNDQRVSRFQTQIDELDDLSGRLNCQI